MPSFGYTGPGTPHSRVGVGLVVAEQELGIAFQLEHVAPELVVLGEDKARLGAQRRLAWIDPPRPRVAEPQRGEHVDGRRLGTRVADGHLDVHVVGRRLGELASIHQ